MGIDLVLFVNGIAVATAELKSDFTQSVGDAVDQYRFDRHPQPKGGRAELKVAAVAPEVRVLTAEALNHSPRG